MKNIIYYISAIVILSFTSCEDVIDVNLKNVDAQIVIEANVVNNLNRQTVKISKTKKFSDDNNFIPYTNAVVTIAEEGNKTFTFTETSPGIYTSEFFIGKPGKKYTVVVKAGNTTYTAISTMPQIVTLDSLSVTELSFFGNKNKFVEVNYNDPINTKNQYNYVISVNNEIRNAYYVDEDRFNDGKVVKNTIFTAEPDLKTDDKVTVDFQCIDYSIYRYFFSISQITGNGGPPTSPSNPNSNFNNGALGYFSAHTSQIVSIKIP